MWQALLMRSWYVFFLIFSLPLKFLNEFQRSENGFNIDTVYILQLFAAGS